MRAYKAMIQLVWAGVLLATSLLASLLPRQSAIALVTVSGPITQDTTWQGEVLVTDHIEVRPGVTLTILPGTRVRFQPYRGYREPERRLSLSVKGTILAAAIPNMTKRVIGGNVITACNRRVSDGRTTFLRNVASDSD